MPNELKPCPFCGGSVSIVKTSDGNEMWWFITRGKDENRCTCRVFMESDIFMIDDPHTIKSAIRNKLIDDWNRRVDND